jgi:hypothetical protein
MNLFLYEVKVLRNAGNEVMHSTTVETQDRANYLATLFAREWQPEPNPDYTIHITPITLLPTKRPV